MSLAKLLSSSAKKRRQNLSSIRFDIQQKLFSRFQDLRTISHHVSATQIPKLWCPLLSHYKTSPNNTTHIDAERNNMHLSYLSNYVGGYLINGSTGDGWTLTTKQQQVILQNTLDFMHCDTDKYFHPILIGALAHDYDAKIQIMDHYVSILQEYYGTDNIDDIYQHSPFVGFAITPPSNTDNQKEIEQCLADIIDRYKQFPFVLYQLPFITNSEMSIETVTNLVHRFGNIIMLKDSSGTDHIVKSQQCLDGVFMVRGMEGDYMESLMNMNYGVAQYHGLLLSTANNYAPQLNQMVHHLLDAKWSEAAQISTQVATVCQDTWDHVTVCGYPFANTFTNASRMVDFWMAHGAKGERMIEMKQNIPVSQDGESYNRKDMMMILDVLRLNGIWNEDFVGYLNESNEARHWWKKH